MKIDFQPTPTSDLLILTTKSEKPATASLRLWGINSAIYNASKKFDQSKHITSDGKVVHFLFLSDLLDPKSIQEQVLTWVHGTLCGLPQQLSLSLSKKLKSQLSAVLIGLQKGRYQINLYKKSEKDAPPFLSSRAKITVVDAHASAAEKAIAKRAIAINEAQVMAMDMINKPNNKLTPNDLAGYAKKSSKKRGYKLTIFNKKQILAKGLDALAAVARGSEFPPAFIIAEYKGKAPKGKSMPKIGLVGKGVTFDTGGISMKGSTNMHYMKSDMGGAAAVLGTIDAAAHLKLPIHLIAIIPTTDNCVDAFAIKPGDIIGSYSGKTIEVIDTDAEGRLILADGLWYMQKHYSPEVMIDLATLTGSSVRTFGYECSALFSTNEKLCNQLREAGDQSGEKCWPLPMWDSYEKEVQSDIADVKNFHSKPIGGAIVAAKFLEIFTNKHTAWAHLDIAGTAFGGIGLGKDKTATGYGIELLITYLEKNFV